MKLSQYSRSKTAFIMIELLTMILIMAGMITVGLVYVGGYINDSRSISDQKTLKVLNDALTRYKCEGGDINALTSGAPIGNVLAKLQQPITWAGMTHTVLQIGRTYASGNLTATGEVQCAMK